MNPATPPADEDKISQAARWWMRMAEGELSDLDRMALDLWLQADPDHARLLSSAVEAWRAIREQAHKPEMMALRSEAVASLQRVKVRRRRRGNFKIALWASAATLIIGIGLSSLWLMHPSNTYATKVGERRVVILPDGSKLSLDALTRVKVRYTAERRQFWLESGRAKFDVAKNPLVPFTVAAHAMLVVATGTQFSTELLPGQVRVDLYEGRVAVLNDRSGQDDVKAADTGGDRLNVQYLAAGEELIASIQGTKDEMGTVRILHQTDAPVWENGQMIFDDERLSVVAERANRYSNQKIILADAETGERRISGVFSAGNTAAILAAITTILPVHAVESNDGAIILSLDRSRIISQGGSVRLEH